MHICILGHDLALVDTIRAALDAGGHDVSWFGEDATPSTVVAQQDCSLLLIVADDAKASTAAGVPTTTMVQQFRQLLPAEMPILVLGIHSAEQALGVLQAGATDYLMKPLRRPEVVLRVEVLLQHAYPDHYQVETSRFGEYVFEPRETRVMLAGQRIPVTQKEFALALLFFRHLGRPLSRATIADAIWPGEQDVPSRTMDTHVSRVRTKLQLRPENGYLLSPVYSFGYQLEQLKAPQP